MIVFKRILDENLCKKNPKALIVFGDNLIEKGKAGQAKIRDEVNAFGVPTKRLPSMNANAFFSDSKDEYNIVAKKLIYLWERHKQGITIILPTSKIGSGLANIKQKSPKISKLIDRFYDSARKEKYPRLKLGT